MLSALRRLYTGIYFIHDKGLPVIDLVFWLYVQVQRYLLLPFSSISPATSVFSVFSLPAPCAPIATCSSPLLRVRVIRASMLLTLTLATQLCVYQSSACSHDYTRALFLLFFLLHGPHLIQFYQDSADQTWSMQSTASFARRETEWFIPHTHSHQGLATENINELPISGILSELDTSNINSDIGP